MEYRKLNEISIGWSRAESIAPKRYGVHLRKLTIRKITFVILIGFLWFAGIGSAPQIANDLEHYDQIADEAAVAQNIDEMNFLPDKAFDFWGYDRLASQIGEDRAREIAGYIEYSEYPDLIKGIITVESSWQIDAESHVQALGLMQIRMIAAREYDPHISPNQLFNPSTNVQLGIQIFEDHMDYFDSFISGEHWALTSYNRGRFGTFALKRNVPRTSYSKKVISITESM